MFSPEQKIPTQLAPTVWTKPRRFVLAAYIDAVSQAAMRAWDCQQMLTRAFNVNATVKPAASGGNEDIKPLWAR